jgi:hypothetical protein
VPGEDRKIEEDARGLKREGRERRRPQRGTSRRGGELVSIERALGRNEDNHHAAVTLEAGRAERRPWRLILSGRELLELPLPTGRAQERGNALNGLRPHRTTIAPQPNEVVLRC